VCGRNAVRALFRARPRDIRRVYVTDETLGDFKDLLKMCAEQRIAYHVKTTADLDAVAETVHHDGVVVYAKERGEASFDDVLAAVDDLGVDDKMAFVLLENVKNPHNLGAILRVCAHFGVPFCLRAGDTPALSPAAMRTAEGGAETTALVDVGDGLAALRALHQRGFSLLATSSHATLSLGGSLLPRRGVVMFGSEGDGLSKKLLHVANDVVAIPGSGALESLNVACASSIVLWELWKPAAIAAPSISAAGNARPRGSAQNETPSLSSSSSESRHDRPSSPAHPRSRAHGARPRRGDRL
jgi:TrmH RNA methyltransferase